MQVRLRQPAFIGELSSIPHFRRPLMPVLLAYGTGVLVGPHLSFEPYYLLPLLLLLLGLTGLTLWTGRRMLATTLLLFGFLLAGSLRCLQAVNPQGNFHVSRMPDAFLGEMVEVEGTIISFPESFAPGSGWRHEGRVRVLTEVDTITADGGRYPATGGVRLSIIGPLQEYRYGHRIKGEFRLRRPRGYWNPGGFNYRRYATTRGFYLEGWGRDGGQIQIVDRKGGSQILRGISDIRETVLKRINVAFPEKEGGMLQAIVLGDRSGISPELREIFVNSGTYHILVISGLHVGFLAGFLYFIGRLLRLPPALRSGLTVLGVVFYTLLAGGSPPIVRAALMTILYLLALIVGRERDLWNTVALAAFLLLLWNPLYLFDAGFQLTFAATVAILVALHRCELSRLPRLQRWVVASLVASVAATLGALPLLALHFNRASLIGAMANLLIVPLGGCLTAVGMTYSLLLFLLSDGIGLLEAGATSVARGMTEVASAFASFPFASVRLYTPTPLMVLMIYAFFGLAVFPGVRKRGFVLGVITLFLMGQVGWKILPSTRQGIEATFLDVGQGDAIYLELPGGTRMLVDGGGNRGGRFDIGERVVAPYLWFRWVRRLDVVVLSHPQPDHMHGLRAVLENFPVGEIWESGYPSSSSTYRWLQAFVRERGIPLRRISRGERIHLGGGVMVNVLHPPRPFLGMEKRRTSTVVNDNSLVLHIDHPESRLLLTGDIEREGEASLLDSGIRLQTDLIKVPHHGSRGSSSASFLQYVGPRWAVVQAGYKNPFGHPHRETLARYAAQGVRVFRTDRDGAVTFEFQDDGVEVRTYRQELGIWAGTPRKYWDRAIGLTREGGYVK
ncbi:MAG: DNA internalization-related competence protein ComEC/Rec2 [Candidatus Methylomirabilales bacterium]